MSSGGGIARFASRKIDTNNPGTTAGSAKNGNDPTTAPSSLPFGTNDNHDTVSTASDDEFGFLNSGNSFGGDDFGFLNDGSFDEEKPDEGTVEVNDCKFALVFHQELNDLACQSLSFRYFNEQPARKSATNAWPRK